MAENIKYYHAAFKNVCEEMAQQDRDLLKAIALPDFVGSVQLDSTRNNAIYLITNFFDILMYIPHGMVRTKDADELVKLNDQLLDAIQLRYGCREEVAICRQAFGKSKAVWRIRNPYRQISPDAYRLKLEQCRDDIFAALNALNVRIYQLEALQLASPRKRGRRRRRGPKTEFMSRQLAVFTAFVERHPVTPSVKAGTRARQCWIAHQADWDRAAENGTGYSRPSALARAYMGAG